MGVPVRRSWRPRALRRARGYLAASLATVLLAGTARSAVAQPAGDGDGAGLAVFGPPFTQEQLGHRLGARTPCLPAGPAVRFRDHLGISEQAATTFGMDADGCVSEARAAYLQAVAGFEAFVALASRHLGPPAGTEEGACADGRAIRRARWVRPEGLFGRTVKRV